MRRPPDPFAPPKKQLATRVSSLLWIVDPLEQDANYMHRRMFGADAAYLDGFLYLVVADREDPWSGLLVCTSKDRHAALTAEIPSLQPHPVLGKWLYLPQTDEAFETTAARIAALALARDPRMGVAPRPKTPSRKGPRVGQ